MIKTKPIPFFTELTPYATTTEILLFGLIYQVGRKSGECWMSTEEMANLLGIKKGTLRNVLSQLRAKGWVEVESAGNRRTSVKPIFQPCGKLSQNCVKVCGKVCGKL